MNLLGCLKNEYTTVGDISVINDALNVINHAYKRNNLLAFNQFVIYFSQTRLRMSICSVSIVFI